MHAKKNAIAGACRKLTTVVVCRQKKKLLAHHDARTIRSHANKQLRSLEQARHSKFACARKSWCDRVCTQTTRNVSASQLDSFQTKTSLAHKKSNQNAHRNMMLSLMHAKTKSHHDARSYASDKWHNRFRCKMHAASHKNVEGNILRIKTHAQESLQRLQLQSLQSACAGKLAAAVASAQQIKTHAKES